MVVSRCPQLGRLHCAGWANRQAKRFDAQNINYRHAALEQPEPDPCDKIPITAATPRRSAGFSTSIAFISIISPQPKNQAGPFRSSSGWNARLIFCRDMKRLWLRMLDKSPLLGLEGLVASLWAYGRWKIPGGPRILAEHIRKLYSQGSARALMLN